MGTVGGMVMLGLAVRSAARLWASVAEPSFFQQMLSCMGALPLNFLFRLIFLDSSLASSMTILLTWEMVRATGCLERGFEFGELTWGSRVARHDTGEWLHSDQGMLQLPVLPPAWFMGRN